MIYENSGPLSAHTIGEVPLISFDELNINRKLHSSRILADIMLMLLDDGTAAACGNDRKKYVPALAIVNI